MNHKQTIGYMLLACKQVGMNKKTTNRLLKAMEVQLSTKTETDAETEGFEWLDHLKENVGATPQMYTHLSKESMNHSTYEIRSMKEKILRHIDC